jgi:hypothetical protein
VALAERGSSPRRRNGSKVFMSQFSGEAGWDRRQFYHPLIPLGRIRVVLTFGETCYRPYRLAYRFTDEDGDHQIFVGNMTVDKWLPGEIELFTEEFFKQPADLPSGEVVNVADTVALPGDLSPGTYKLSVAVVGEEDTEPVVRIGIEGRSKDGWYPLSTLTISR